MQVIDAGGGLAESTFRLLRSVLQASIFFAAVAAARWGILTFLLNRGGLPDRRLYRYSAANLLALILLLLLRDPADRLLTALGDAISGLRPESGLDWPAEMLVGIYYALIVSLMLFLAIHVVGLVRRLADKRIDVWQARLRASVTAGESNPRFHASRVVRVCIRLFSQLLATVLILAYFFAGFADFPRTRVFTRALRTILKAPLRDAATAIENYVPNLGYIFVILLFGWILLKGLKYLFGSIQKGTIVLERFPADWADPTYKLCRTILFLLVLMVSFPYLPGSDSQFFRGFSVFVGALVTFGSSGVIGNILAGILLTYARAFKVGDVVQIEGVYGKVIEKTLLVTRVLTAGQQHVAIPNSKVLTNSVTNYSNHGLGRGVAVSVPATIGYEVDWRTVHKLLIEGATRTEEIATEPAPFVMEQSFGNYSVEYHLRAWTKTSDGIFESYAALRRNVLDAFADAGIEIMTPTILSHRDASDLAVPAERFPSRPRPKGIRVSVDPPNRLGD
ncbi:MAG: mechanosensitive ion channel family protein [Bryobacteraceae bacterium]